VSVGEGVVRLLLVCWFWVKGGLCGRVDVVVAVQP